MFFRGCQFDFQTGAAHVPPLHHLLGVYLSAPPVHSAFAQNSIFLNPETFSCFDNKRITTPDFLKGQEVEVSQVVAWQVKVLPHPSVPVVVHSPPVLCATDPAGPCWSNLPDILGWFPQAWSSTMGASDVIDNIGVLTCDRLLYRPSLPSQGARVGPGVLGVDAAQAPRLATLSEAWL